MKVDLTTTAKNLSGEVAKIELSRFQTADGHIASQQRDMVLQDVFFGAVGGSTIQDAEEIKEVRELTKKVKTGKPFDATDNEFARLYAIYKTQKFYIFDSFLEMLEANNKNFNMETYEATLLPKIEKAT